jgi:ABC-type hemin transport system substrate-binding protein
MRIVSLLPSAAESLYALGLGDQLVAVTRKSPRASGGRA